MITRLTRLAILRRGLPGQWGRTARDKGRLKSVLRTSTVVSPCITRCTHLRSSAWKPDPLALSGLRLSTIFRGVPAGIRKTGPDYVRQGLFAQGCHTKHVKSRFFVNLTSSPGKPGISFESCPRLTNSKSLSGKHAFDRILERHITWR